MEAIKVSLAAFLRTGVLGPIQRGMPFYKMKFFVGSPQYVQYRERREHAPSIAWYGSIELGLYDRPPSRVHYIQIEHGNQASGRFAGYGRLILHDDGFDPCTATIETFERFARKNRIGFIPVSPPWDSDDQICLLTQGGVSAWFSRDPATGRTRFDTFITDNPSWFRIRHKPLGFIRDKTSLRIGRWLDPEYQRRLR